MANNKIQVKRTNVSGRTPNTTNSSNSQYISAGELALNMTDGILYTSNGSSLITIGANNSNVNVTTQLTANSIIAGKLQHSPVPISKLLTAFDVADEDLFGSAISLSSDASVLSVSSPYWEGATGSNRGGVYIFDWNGSNWIQRGSILEAADAADIDQFGISLSLSSNGSILAVGANGWEGATGNGRGGVYIYDWNGSAWIQRGSVLEAADAIDGDFFGQSVSLSSNGSILAVGTSSWEGVTGSNRGGVYIYDWNGSAWIQRGSVLEAADAADNDSYGQSVSLSSDGSILAVGAGNWEGATGTNRGGVYIYDWNGTSWVQRGSVLEAADAADNDSFGNINGVSLNSVGSILAVGAIGWEGVAGADRGGVYIYDWNGSSWIQRGSVLEAVDAADTDRLGPVSLSSDGSILVSSAYRWEGATGTNRGAVYTYSLTGALPSSSGVATGSGWIEGANSALIARTAGLDRITVADNGNVGVGTTSPAYKLDLDGTERISTTAGQPLLLYKYGSAAPTIAMFAANGTKDSPTQTLTGDIIGGINMFGYGPTGFAGGPSIRIRGVAAENNGTTSARGTDLTFETVNLGGVTAQERLRITANGDIGIGISLPTAKLSVANSVSPTSQHLYGTYTDGSNYERINFTANSTGHYILGEETGTGLARTLNLGANNASVMSIYANNTVQIKHTLLGRSSIDHVTYSIFEAGVDEVRLFNDASRSGSGYAPSSILIGGRDTTNNLDAFRLQPGFLRLGVRTLISRPQADANNTSWGSSGILNIVSNENSDNLGIGISSARTYGWLQYWSGGTATNLVINPNGGNVGIGTKSPLTKLHLLDPTSTALTLQGATWSSTPTIWFGDDSSTTMGRIVYVNNGDYLVMGANGETNTLAVTSGGKVGVGLVSPVGKLHVKSFGSLYDTVLVLDNDGGNRYTGMQYRNDGVWKSGSYYDNTTAYMVQNTVGGYLFFANNGVEALRINTNGQVGIGINPNVKLAISSGTSPTSQHIYGTFTDISNYERINFTANSTGHYILGEESGTGLARNLFFGANNNTLMTVAANGNIGIGTTSPTAKLHVAGNVTSGTITLLTNADSLITNKITKLDQFQELETYVAFNSVNPLITWYGGTGAKLVYNTNLLALYPSITGGIDLGTPSLKWKNGYFNTNLIVDGNVGIGNSNPTSKLVVSGNTVLGTDSTSSTSIGGIAIINNDVEIAARNTAANASNTQTIISTFSANKYRGGKFTIFGKRSTESHITEVLLTHNTSNVYLTEYSVLFTNTSLFSVSATITSGNVQIILTSSLSDINYDIFENKFINELNAYDRSQTLVLDRSGSTIETRAA